MFTAALLALLLILIIIIIIIIIILALRVILALLVVFFYPPPAAPRAQVLAVDLHRGSALRGLPAGAITTWLASFKNKIARAENVDYPPRKWP